MGDLRIYIRVQVRIRIHARGRMRVRRASGAASDAVVGDESVSASDPAGRLAPPTRLPAYAYGDGKRMSGGRVGVGDGGSMAAGLRPSATAATMPESRPVRWPCQEMCIVVTSAEG